MRYIKAFLLPCLLMAGIIPLLRSSSDNMKPESWQVHRVGIPGFVVEYKMPPDLKLGQGGLRDFVTFDNPETDQYTSRLGDGVYSKDVGVWFHGVRGDFRDWDSRVNLIVLKFDPKQKPISSVADLAKYFQEKMSKEMVMLKNGKAYPKVQSVKIEPMGPLSVVVVTSADLYHLVTLDLKDGGKTDLRPFQLYYLRIDDEISLGIRVYQDSVNQLTLQWYENYRTTIEAIIQSVKIQPKSL